MINLRNTQALIIACALAGSTHATDYETFCAVKKVEEILGQEVEKRSGGKKAFWGRSYHCYDTDGGIILDVLQGHLCTPWGMMRLAGKNALDNIIKRAYGIEVNGEEQFIESVSQQCSKEGKIPEIEGIDVERIEIETDAGEKVKCHVVTAVRGQKVATPSMLNVRPGYQALYQHAHRDSLCLKMQAPALEKKYEWETFNKQWEQEHSSGD